MMPAHSVIEIRDWERPPRRVNLQGPLIIGRECPGFNLTDVEVSRRHLRLIPGPASLSAVDLGSSNGTTLNGRPLTGTVSLSPGDRLKLGRSEIVVVSAPQPNKTRLNLQAVARQKTHANAPLRAVATPQTESLPPVPAPLPVPQTESLPPVPTPLPVPQTESLQPVALPPSKTPVAQETRPSPIKGAVAATSDTPQPVELSKRLGQLQTKLLAAPVLQDKRRLAWWAGVLVLAAAIPLVLITTRSNPDPVIDDASQRLTVTTTAQAAVTDVNTYTPDTVATVITHAADTMSDTFKPTFGESGQKTVAAVQQSHETQMVEHTDAAVQTLTDDKAVVLVLLRLNQTHPDAAPVQIDKPVTVRLVRNRNSWLVDGIDSVWR
jgi:pSer/pThr/pTyr-binding forkhead associated (FHA) protein